MIGGVVVRGGVIGAGTHAGRHVRGVERHFDPASSRRRFSGERALALDGTDLFFRRRLITPNEMSVEPRRAQSFLRRSPL